MKAVLLLMNSSGNSKFQDLCICLGSFDKHSSVPYSCYAFIQIAHISNGNCNVI